MSAQHTPGPWHTAGDQGVQIRSQRDQIAKVWTMRGNEWKANARLIAAAPDLLGACETFHEWLVREEIGFANKWDRNTEEGEAKWREWYGENLRLCALAQEQARAAIAKATNPD